MKSFKVMLYTITVFYVLGVQSTVLADCPDSHIDYINCELNDGSEQYVEFSRDVGNCWNDQDWVCYRCHNDWKEAAIKHCRSGDKTLSGRGRAHFNKIHGRDHRDYFEHFGPERGDGGGAN